MKLTIEGTEQEIKNTLQAIGGSKEREEVSPEQMIDSIESALVGLNEKPNRLGV